MDARAAADAIMSFTRGRTLDNYQSDAMRHSAVERQFEIVGEAQTAEPATKRVAAPDRLLEKAS